jgi:hypothetical protein
MKKIAGLFVVFFTTVVFAGFGGYQSTTNLGVFNNIKCSSGLTCTKVGDKFNITTAVVSGGQFKTFGGWAPSLYSNATSVTSATASVHLVQARITSNATLTGIKVLNANTVGTDKYIVALFNSSGVKVANSALAGVTTAGTNAYQAIPFTATYSVTGGEVYWLGVYLNGTTDRFFGVPVQGENAGYAGSVAGQTFGTIISVTLPTAFTPDKGPVAFTY